MSHRGDSTNHVDHEVLKNARYMVVVIDKHGLVDRLECPGIQWQVDGLRIGLEPPETIKAIIDAAAGSITPKLFPYVQLATGVSADIHILNRKGKKQIILQEVSERYDAEHRYQQKAHEVSLLLEKQAELNHLLEEKRVLAEEASQAKSRFIASMSHEFRSPISSIMAHAEVLRSAQPDAREPAAVLRASWYLLTLVENLLEQARIGEGELRLDLTGVDVPGLLDDMRALFEIQASSRGLTLEVDHSDDVGLVHADEMRLRQVLVNLLSNAVRYTREGGISLVCRRQGDAVEFCVADTGKGIDEDDLERIFKPFTRVNPGGEGGAGLGLTISRQLIAGMNGDLSVKSKTGEGSTFSFTLPVSEEDQQESVKSLEGLSVLLVEDDDDIVDIYRIWLEDWGLRIRTVSRLDQAIAEFEHDPVDLVLTDLFLEDGNGVELLNLVRNNNPQVATVLCSGSDSIMAYCGGDESAIDCFVSKPVSPIRLEAALQSAVRKASRK